MDVGLDPEDTHESEHDPIGIGNLCGRKINEFRDQDGMNSKGDIITGRQNTKYNHEPFAKLDKHEVLATVQWKCPGTFFQLKGLWNVDIPAVSVRY